MKQLFNYLFLLLALINFKNTLAQEKNQMVLKPFKVDDKYGYKDSITNEIVIPAKYQKATDFRNGVAYITLDKKLGCIDLSGKIIVPVEYDFIFSFEEGLAWVLSDRKFGFVNKSGQVVIPLIYDRAYNFRNGIACVEQNNKWGYIDKAGKVIIPIKYDGLETGFHNGLAFANLGGKGDGGFTKGGKWGYIDNIGNVIIPFKYDKVSSFRNDSAFVKKNKSEFWINSKGEKLK